MQQVDAKAGVAHVELMQQDHDQTGVENAEGQKATSGAPTEGLESGPADADGSRVFFLLKVRANDVKRENNVDSWCFGRLFFSRLM